MHAPLQQQRPRAAAGALPTIPTMHLAARHRTTFRAAPLRPGRRPARRLAPVAAAAPPAPPPGQPAPPPEVKYPVRLETLPLTPTVTMLRATCSERLPEIQFGQRKGTTTNSYLIAPSVGAPPEVLIDVPSKAYDYDLSAWLGDLDALRTLRVVVITRLNPERLEPLKKLLVAAPGPLRLLASNPALQLLRERATADPALAALLDGGRVTPEAIGRGTEAKLTSGKQLRFIPVPTPRWPDLVAAYLPDQELLFSSSFFAAHEAPEVGKVFDDGGWDSHGDAWKYYYDCMLAPAAKQAAVALDRLRINATAGESTGNVALDGVMGVLRGAAKYVTDSLGVYEDEASAVSGAAGSGGMTEPIRVALLAPIHGPVVRGSLTQLVRRYGDWTAAQVAAADTASVAVLYASAYGNTAALAQAISRGVTKAGVGVETLNLEVVGVEDVERALQSSQGFVIGSPTLGGHMPTQVQTALGAILKSGGEARALPCGVFGSFGWSGEAVDMMEGRLKDAGFQFAFPAIRCKFKPTEATLQQCEESGTDLAQAIKREMKKKEKVAAAKMGAAESAPAAALALGRVVGSLCVLTAKDGDAKGAMLASWVSQASFDPPGLTVAVKKDRAVESLLPVGNKFVLNVLAEGKDKGVMKAMLKPFAPGQDRFDGSGLGMSESEVSGAVVFDDAAAFMECTVAQRMETGDHWLIYATVEGGKVLDDRAQSAVHFRKSAMNY